MCTFIWMIVYACNGMPVLKGAWTIWLVVCLVLDR